ncbi:thiamine diphosphate-binding protein [Fimicolochytrium jonesii]|uniref:thiamine diphosphate-binding protein n=1 Tax=Fimicolochytrium jonesii TaxID=1396493 RepID=UPI0022FEB00E|nr:thiamine diphosphate-binding protein [Fimicolochytrium jonesii]KAI8818041.1 thiamine diphosphate-binding protein [Fimicolochytrium jonesii]
MPSNVTQTAKEALNKVLGKGSPYSCTVGDYLLHRLREVGCSMIFGVPGDFNMEFLDQIEDFEGIEWGANANELNAGYAADGYARIKGIGALCTTFGVGELSAINAIAGSQAELVPVVHIVGTPSTVSQADGAILHHTLGNGDFHVFQNMSVPVTVAQTSLVPSTAASEIDRVLTQCLLHRRPVYIALPTDVALKNITGTFAPLDLTHTPNPPEAEREAISHILSAIKAAQSPAILIDGCAQRFHVERELRRFIDASGFPVYEAPMGKGIVSEFHPQFRGSYVGELTPANVRTELEGMDLVIMVGAIKSDFNTGGFTFHIPPEKLIELHSTHTTIFHAQYNRVGFRGVLDKLAEALPTPRPWVLPPVEPVGTVGKEGDSEVEIRHDFFWDALGTFLGKEPYIVVAETGTSSFGTSTQRLADGSRYVSQVLYGSIGFATAAALGTAVAGRELDRPLRTVLVTGDGSFQLTGNELSTFLRHKLTPIIIIINNDGYTIERYIHGPTRRYNRTAMWSYAQSLSYFSVPQDKDTYPKFGLQRRVEAKKDVVGVLTQAFEERDSIHVVEVVMPTMDAPQGMIKTAEKAREENKYDGDS